MATPKEKNLELILQVEDILMDNIELDYGCCDDDIVSIDGFWRASEKVIEFFESRT